MLGAAAQHARLAAFAQVADAAGGGCGSCRVVGCGGIAGRRHGAGRGHRAHHAWRRGAVRGFRHHAGLARDCAGARLIKRVQLAQLVGGSLQKLLVHLRCDRGHHRAYRHADDRAGDADLRRQQHRRHRRQCTGCHLRHGQALKQPAEPLALGSLLHFGGFCESDAVRTGHGARARRRKRGICGVRARRGARSIPAIPAGNGERHRHPLRRRRAALKRVRRLSRLRGPIGTQGHLPRFARRWHSRILTRVLRVFLHMRHEQPPHARVILSAVGDHRTRILYQAEGYALRHRPDTLSANIHRSDTDPSNNKRRIRAKPGEADTPRECRPRIKPFAIAKSSAAPHRPHAAEPCAGTRPGALTPQSRCAVGARRPGRRRSRRQHTSR